MSDWDDDIAAMSLTDLEKNGLQVYRNYQRAFENHAEKEFAKEIDAERLDLSDIKRVLNPIVTDDPRFVPVISCAYADDLLKGMFKAEVPDGVPGGKKNLLGPFGPFSDLSKRLQLAYVFELLSPDLIVDLDLVRKTRNELSHSWDVEGLQEYLLRAPITKITPIESLLVERPDWFPREIGDLNPVDAFRVRIIWLLARLTYEVPLYARVRHRRLHPAQALYGVNRPDRLPKISELAMRACRKVIYPAGMTTPE